MIYRIRDVYRWYDTIRYDRRV